MTRAIRNTCSEAHNKTIVMKSLINEFKKGIKNHRDETDSNQVKPTPSRSLSFLDSRCLWDRADLYHDSDSRCLLDQAERYLDSNSRCLWNRAVLY